MEEQDEREAPAQPAALSDGVPVPASGLSEADMAANGWLKERALRFWLSLVSQPVTLHMYEKCVPLTHPTTCPCSCGELTIDHLVPRNATQRN